MLEFDGSAIDLQAWQWEFDPPLYPPRKPLKLKINHTELLFGIYIICKILMQITCYTINYTFIEILTLNRK